MLRLTLMNKILRKIRKTFYLNQIRPGPRFGRLPTILNLERNFIYGCGSVFWGISFQRILHRTRKAIIPKSAKNILLGKSLVLVFFHHLDSTLAEFLQQWVFQIEYLNGFLCLFSLPD